MQSKRTILVATIIVSKPLPADSARKGLYPDVEPKFIDMAGITAVVPASKVTYPHGLIDNQITIISESKGAFVIAPQRPDASELFFGK